MNRIQLLAGQPQAKGKIKADHASLRVSKQAGLQHSLFAPLHYEKNYAYPLLVWLHGPGDDERQIQRIMPHVSMRNYVAVGPRGTVAAENDRGYAWTQSEHDVSLAEQKVFDCIEQAKERFSIAPRRVYVGGYGCGGTMAFRVALRHPTCFAAALSLCGALPTGNNPLASLQQARRVPVFIANGRDSVDYPVEQMCDNLRLLHVAGLNVTLRQYPCGDEVNTQMLHDMDVWLMEQVTGISTSADELSGLNPGEMN